MPAVSAIKNLKVLLVDDFSVMRRIVRGTLREEGCVSFVEASDGAEALEVLESESVDLIVADWHMPEMEGLELLKTIRKDKRFKQLPFVMLATRKDAEKIPAALKTTRATYLTKPFLPEDLVQSVKKVCKKRRKTSASSAKKKAPAKKKKAGSTKTKSAAKSTAKKNAAKKPRKKK